MKKGMRGVHISAAVNLLLFPVLNFVCYSILKEVFQFPDILRRPAVEVFQLFQQNVNIIVPTYYTYAMTGLIFIFFSVLLYRSFENRDSAILQTSTAIGILSGLIQIIAFARWAFVKPYLASVFTDPASSEATRAAVVVAYECFNRYVGMGVGENIGHVTWGAWTIGIGISILVLKGRLFDRKLGWSGVIIGCSFIIYSLEQLGVSSLWVLVVPVYAAFFIWQLFMAYSLIRTDVDTGEGPGLSWIALLVAVFLFVVFAGPAFFR